MADTNFDIHVIGGKAKYREREEHALETASLMEKESGTSKLNQKKFAELKRVLSTLPPGATEGAEKPNSSTDGVITGYLLYQGKAFGLWKKAWFVLKPPFLYQYASETHYRPKKINYVSYALADRITMQDLEQEIEDGGYVSKLEEKAGSLRINVFTGNKMKVLSATSEETMEQWLSALDASVAQHSSPALLESKREAAHQLKPLMAAQLFHEVDLMRALMKNLSDSGLLSADANPILSKRKAKGGKLWLLKHGRDLTEEVGEEFLYFVLVDHFIYYYQEVVPIDDFYEVEQNNAFFNKDGDASTDVSADGYKWKGFINLKLAKVGIAPPSVLKDHRRLNSIMIQTPVRTYVLVAMHELASEDWLMQIQAAQQGTPLKERKSKMNLIDVYNDAVADKLESDPQSLTLNECLTHQVTCFYLSKHVSKKDAALGESLLIYKEFAKLERLTIQDLVVQKAKKIRSLQVSRSTYYDAATLSAVDDELRDDDFITPNCFQRLKDVLSPAAAQYFDAFKKSPQFGELLQTLGPKYLEVTRDDDKKYREIYALGGETVVGRGDPRDDGRQYVQLWREGDDARISREQCKLSTGKLALLVVDLGSSNGTRYTPGADGRVIKMDHLPPGGALYLGNYVLSYRMGEAPQQSARKSRSVFGLKKK